jgi:hypothetical protein
MAGTNSLKALANKVLARKKAGQVPGQSAGQGAEILSHKGEVRGTRIELSQHENNPPRPERKLTLRERCQLPGHCPCCGGTDFWKNNVGNNICQNCHPGLTPRNLA